MPKTIDAEIVLPVIVGGGSIKSISKNGVELPIDSSGNVDIIVPTKVSEFENDEQFVKDSDLAGVAKSGDYNDLENTPAIPVVPTNVSDFNNDAGYITKDVDNLTNYTKTSELPAVARTGDYDDLDNKPDIGDIATNVANSAVSTHNESETAHSDIRNEIGTVKDIAEGANIAIVFNTYSELVTFFNAESDSLKVGTNLYVKTLEVPDLWLSAVESNAVSYTYTTDSDFLAYINSNGQIGYYKFSELETQKVDLSNYATLTDLAGKVDKLIPSVANNITLLNAQGNMKDSGIQPSNLLLYNSVILNTSTASWNSGGYYSIANGTTLNSGTGYYISQLDISEYAGYYMFIDVNAIASASSRACLITDENGNVVAQGVERLSTSTDPQFIYDTDINKYRLEIKLPSNAKYAYLSVSTNATSRTIQFGYKKADIAKNGRVGIIYVDAVNGSDINDGSKTSPLKSFSVAVGLATRKGYRDTTFILSEGKYREIFNISSLIGRVTVIGSNLGETIFDNSYILANWSAVSGHNGVYSCTHTGSVNRFSNAGGVIFEDLHESKQISNSERHPLQKGLTYRLPFTPIYESTENNLNDALIDIETNGGWYIDGTTIYIKNSDGSDPNANGYSYKLPRSNFNNSAPNITSVHIMNISWRYGYNINFKVPYLERENCSVIGSWGNGFIDDRYNVRAYRDEACFCNNDGIQGHGTVTTDWQTLSVRAYTPSCEYIDCWCHDNFDDGLSFHEASKISVRGGLFEHNWDGGIRMSNSNASFVTDAYARYNGEALSGTFTGSGFDAVNAKFTNEQRTGVTCVFQNCISEGNKYGFACDTSATYAFVEVINCTSKNNITAEFYNAAANAVLNILNSDCTPLDMSKIASGIGTININCARPFTFSLGSINYATIALPASAGTAEYNGTFTSTTSGDITVSLPLTYWSGDTTIVIGKTYSFSIQNGVGFIIQLD